jgi:CRP/FNR family cyclic AMP-dependent transcriptional regulator
MKNVTGEARLTPKIVGSQIARMRGWLSKTPPTFQEEVLKRCRSLTFQPGETLYHLGEEHGGIYGLIEGGVAISAAPTDRGPYLIHFGRPGFWAGAAPLFMSRRLVSVTTTRPSVCLHLPQNEIQAMVAGMPSAWRLFGMLAMFNCDLTLSALDDLMIREPVKRCAAVLLRLGDCRDPNLTEKSPIELDVRQEDIAMMANLSRSATSNFRRSLADRNVISLEYRIIRILDAEALRNEANTA